MATIAETYFSCLNSCHWRLKCKLRWNGSVQQLLQIATLTCKLGWEKGLPCTMPSPRRRDRRAKWPCWCEPVPRQLRHRLRSAHKRVVYEIGEQRDLRGRKCFIPMDHTFASVSHLEYREGHLVADLCWVDFVLGWTAVCQILLGQVRIRQYWHTSRAKWWNSQDNCQTNPSMRQDVNPCSLFWNLNAIFNGKSHYLVPQIFVIKH